MPYNPMNWEERNVPLSQISLDTENLRLDPHYGQEEIDAIRCLIEKHAIIELCQSIVRYKNLYLESKVILLQESSDFIVLEGNRRICACKVLFEPSLCTNPEYYDQIPKLDDKTRNNLMQIPALIVPDRLTADEVIGPRHAGDSFRDWSELARMRYVEKRSSWGRSLEDIADSLNVNIQEVSRLRRLKSALDATTGLSCWSEGQSQALNDYYLRFDVFESVIFSSKIEKFFGEGLFSREGFPNSSWQNFEDILSKIAEDTLISQKMNTTHRLTSDRNIDKYLLERFPKPDEPQKPLPLDEPSSKTGFDRKSESKENSLSGDEYSSNKSSIDSKPDTDDKSSSSTPDDTVERKNRRKPYKPPPFFQDIECARVDDARMMQLTEEIRNLEFLRFRYAGSFLMRALLECCLVYHLKKRRIYDELQKQKKGKHSLDDLLHFCINKRVFSTEQVAKKLAMIQKEVPNLHYNAHNHYGNIELAWLEKLAGDIKPVIRHIMAEETYE